MDNYPLALVRAAVVSQLPSLQVKFEEATQFKKHDTVSFFFAKLNLSVEQLKQLTPEHEGGGRNHPSLQELKLALNSARQLGEVKITSLERTCSVNLTANSERITVTKKTIKEPEHTGLVFTLQASELEDPNALLKKRCRWAPLTWSINPKRLIHRLTKKDAAKNCKVLLHRKNLELTGKLKDIPHKAILKDTQKFNGLHFLGWRPEEEHDSKVLGLKHGVTYPLSVPGLAKQVFCLVDCHELELDTKTNQFVSGDALNDKNAIVREAFEYAQSLTK